MSKTITSLDELEKNKKRKIFFHSPFRYIIMLIICAVITLTYLFNNTFEMLYWSNALFISGVVSLSTGLLSLSQDLGTFDGVSYTTMRLARNILSRPQRYDNIKEYIDEKEARKDKSKITYMPYIVIGVILIIIGAIVSYIYSAQLRG